MYTPTLPLRQSHTIISTSGPPPGQPPSMRFHGQDFPSPIALVVWEIQSPESAIEFLGWRTHRHAKWYGKPGQAVWISMRVLQMFDQPWGDDPEARHVTIGAYRFQRMAWVRNSRMGIYVRVDAGLSPVLAPFYRLYWGSHETWRIGRDRMRATLVIWRLADPDDSRGSGRIKYRWPKKTQP